jgi:LysR family transcriptional regulator, low CO2-responsive transcriptional regulator
LSAPEPSVHFTFRQMQIFESVARLLSFSRAAEELHLTQPAVSMQIRQLEDTVGLPLLEQVGKKIHLTEAGEELHHHCRVVARQLREAKEAMESLRQGVRGRLDIAIISTAEYFMPMLLARFCEAHPDVQLRLSVGNRERILEQLADNEVDMAVMGRPPAEVAVSAEPFARNPHVVIAAPGHRFANAKRLSVERIAEEPLILREKGSGTRQLLERLFSEHGLKLNARMEMSSNEVIKRAVAAGMGISLLSLHTLQLELQTGCLVILPVHGLPVVRDWHLVHLKDKRLPPVARAFKSYMLEHAERVIGEFTAAAQSGPAAGAPA